MNSKRSERPCGKTSEAALRGRIGAWAQKARHDAREMTKAARAKFLERFYDEVDPDRTLEPQERERRARAARQAYFARLAYRSAIARRTAARKGAR